MRLRVSITVSEMCEIFVERYCKPRKTTWKDDKSRLDRFLVPRLGDTLLDEVTRQDIAGVHAEVGRNTPYQANRLRENIHTMFEMAKEWGHIPESSANPASRIKEFQEKSRERFLSADEVTRLVMSIREEDVFIRAAILLLLLTGLRRNEVLRLKWENIDFERGLATIPKTKNGELALQPLSPPAIRVLHSIPRYTKNPFVIVGMKPGKPRYDLTKAWDRIKSRAQITDVRVHDLRHTCGTWLAQEGVDIMIIKNVLNHKDLKSTMVYVKHSVEQQREALDVYGNRIEKLIS